MAESTTKTAVVTAVLTGIFTVAAGVATYWLTTKEPELSYSVAGGPALAASTGSKRIFVVELRNSGRKEVSQAMVHLSVKQGELTETASEASAGVKLTEERTSRQVEIRADLLNPGDIVKVSTLISLNGPSSEPDVVVRAPGIQAIQESGVREGLFSKKKLPDFASLMVAAIAAVLSSFAMLSGSRIGRRLGIPALASSLKQAEIGAYVCGACGLHEEAEQLRFGGADTSYRGIADYLRHRAQRFPSSQRSAYSTALRALLLTKGYSSDSVQAIRAAIDVIEESKVTEEEFTKLRNAATEEGSSPVAWREHIDSYVQTSQKGS